MKIENSISSYLREPQVFNLTKLSKSTRWRLERAGKFPRRRQLSKKAVGWLSYEVDEWVKSRGFANEEEGKNV